MFRNIYSWFGGGGLQEFHHSSSCTSTGALWCYALHRIVSEHITAMEGQRTSTSEFTIIRKLVKPSLALCLESPLAHLQNLLASILGTYQPTQKTWLMCVSVIHYHAMYQRSSLFQNHPQCTSSLQFGSRVPLPQHNHDWLPKQPKHSIGVPLLSTWGRTRFEHSSLGSRVLFAWQTGYPYNLVSIYITWRSM